jgi:predicted 2-oxoglutarate/Fe(II)-dependent dioxygenase YbiX
LTVEECKDLIEKMDKSCTKTSPALLAASNTVVMDFTNRFTYQSSIPHEPDCYPLLERAAKAIDEFFSVEIEHWETPSFKIYPVGGHFSLHADTILDSNGRGIKFQDRDYSAILFLNDDYEGGELVFPDLKVTVSASVGRLVSFPCTRAYMHKVEKVTAGTRYQILTFLKAKGTKIEHDPAVYGRLYPRVDRKTWEIR